MNAPASSRLIGAVHFDPRTGELSDGDRVTRLRPQAAAVLEMLVENAGDLVTRAALRSRVWPAGGHEADLGLNVCVAQIRAALGDNVDQPDFVETLRGRGYRLIAPVSAPAPPPPRHATALPRRWMAALVAMILLAVAVVVVGRASLERAAPLRLAILPFELLPPSDSLEYLRLAVMQDLITALANLEPERLVVLGRTSALTLAATGVEADEVARQVDADLVLAGAIQHGEGAFRVTAQLLDAESGTYAWAREWDPGQRSRTASELIDSRLLTAVGLASGAERPQGRNEVSPASAEALARARFLAGRFSAEDSRRAVDVLEEALRSDPEEVALRVELARHHLILGDLEQAEADLGAARALDSSAEGLDHVAGRVALYGRRDPEAALPHLTGAAADYPGTAEIRHDLAHALLATGESAEAAAQGDVALDLDPVSSVVRGDMGWVYYYAGRTDDARRVCHSTLELVPESGGARRCILFSAGLGGAVADEVEFVRGLLAELGAGDDRISSLVSAIERGDAIPLWNWLLDGAVTALTHEDRARLLTLAGQEAEARAAWQQALAPPTPLFTPFDPLRRLPNSRP